MVEFSLAGVASITLLISTFQLAMGMWNYHTLAYAVHEATRYAAVHGVGCTKTGNTCAVTLGTIARKIATAAIGVASDRAVVTFTTDSGTVTTCSPLNTCFTDGTVWPPAANSDNKVGKLITISVKYPFSSMLLFFWPGAGTMGFGSVWLPASSAQRILF